ncbi:hypothetical protein PA7_15310 [Pseudonocardia asaccharolytica DSM 44247 = NBRC 16224]|uniref:Uncharacterized protein n=2 Tax=Pseudonocardia asaccharolytica TaxID=54010 RepID=A0A511D2A8_9PSEU|nr:hypothetical protein PA7_15310 [Pseudonocardia asaccharolytica DSM 44247 = NBRC 16224]
MSGALLAVPGAALAGGAALATLKVATAGFGDALSSMDDPAKFAEAIADLAPAAQETARAFQALRPEATALRQEVQGRFFAGFADDVGELGGTYLPILKTGMSGVAGEMNAMGRSAAKALMAPSAVNDVNEVLGGTQDLLREMRPALGNVLSGLLGLGGVGASKLGRLGSAVDSVTGKFKRWVDAGVESGRISQLIDQGAESAKKFGTVLGNLGSIGGTVFSGLSSGQGDFLDGMVTTTQAVEDFFKSVEGQEALKALGETLKVAGDVTRDVLMAALREAGPLIVELAPAAQAAAKAFGGTLVSALQVVGPLLQGLAGFLSEHKEVVAAVVPLLVAYAGGLKALKVAQSVAGWLGGATSAIDGLGRSADGAAKKTGTLRTKLGGLKGLGAAAAVAAVAVEMDKVNLAAAGGNADNLSYWGDQLHDFVEAAGQIASGDIGGIFDEIGWEWQRIVNNINGNHPDPIKLQADGTAAQGDLDRFITQVNSAAPEVNINGNSNGAGFALRHILSEIAAGKESVLIEGKTVPVQDALAYVLRLIDESVGTVPIDGNTEPAGGALATLLNRAGASKGVVPIDADTAAAHGKITAEIAYADGSTGTVAIDGDPRLVNGKIVQSVKFADGSTGTMVLDANPDPATGKINGTVQYGDRQHATITLDPRDLVTPAIDNIPRTGTTVWTIKYIDEGRRPGGSAPRPQAMGGVLAPMASGGMLKYFNGHRLRPMSGSRADVVPRNTWRIIGDNMRVPEAFIPLDRSARSLSILAEAARRMGMRIAPMAAGGLNLPDFLASRIGAAASSGAAPRVTVGGTNITVILDGQPIRAVIREELDRRDRETRRTVGAGAGVGY